jgi:signal transduction histidine kinase
LPIELKNDSTLPIALALALALILAAVLPSGICHAQIDQTARNRVLIMGGDHNYPPYEFLGRNGEPEGYNVEMTKAIASVMGLEIKIVLGPWNDMFGKLKSGEIDIIQGILKSPEREAYLDFSAPYAIVAQSIFARKGGHRNISVADLRGREVIVQHNGFMEEYLRRVSPETIFIQEDTHVDALRLLAAGKHDFAVVAVPLGINLQKRYHLSNIEPATTRLWMDYASDLPPILGNPQRLTQVAVNLIVNACQALDSPEKGIGVRTQHDKLTGHVVFTVTDEGTGILPEHLPRLTGPFFTTKRESGGTGIGLSVSLSIIREHGGDLKFESDPGRKTTAMVILPTAGMK